MENVQQGKKVKQKLENNSENNDSIAKASIKELSETFKKLVLLIKPETPGEPSITSFCDLCRLWQEQVANLTTIQNMQAEDYQKQINELHQVRQKLLDDLKYQEDTHLQEIEELKQKSKIELEAKDKICLQLEDQIERQCGQHELSCCICLDPWTSCGYHRLVALACGHLFGDACIRKYLQRESLCPYCRAGASKDDIRYIYGRPI